MTKAKNTKNVKNVKTVQKAELPEGLAVVLPELSEEKMEVMIAEYGQKQRDKFESRLEARKECFGEKLKEKGATDHEVLVRRILITNLQEEMKTKRNAIKQLKEEIRSLRVKATEDRKAKKAQVVKEIKAKAA